jgi:hypothetical protein
MRGRPGITALTFVLLSICAATPAHAVPVTVSFQVSGFGPGGGGILVHAQYKDKKEPIQKDRAAVGESGESLDGRADRDRGDRQITGMDKGGKDKQPSKGKDTKDKSYLSRP